jgi:hypothetical protein
MPKRYPQDKDLPSSNFDDFALYSNVTPAKQKEANIALYEAIINLWDTAEKYCELGAFDTGSREAIMVRVFDLQWPYNYNQVKKALEKEKKSALKS